MSAGDKRMKWDTQTAITTAAGCVLNIWDTSRGSAPIHLHHLENVQACKLTEDPRSQMDFLMLLRGEGPDPTHCQWHLTSGDTDQWRAHSLCLFTKLHRREKKEWNQHLSKMFQVFEDQLLHPAGEDNPENVLSSGRTTAIFVGRVLAAVEEIVLPSLTFSLHGTAEEEGVEEGVHTPRPCACACHRHPAISQWRSRKREVG